MTELAIRWFAPHDGFRPMERELAQRGVRIQGSGERRAEVALAMGDPVAEDAWTWSRQHHTPLVLYLWDLPPWAVGPRNYHPVIAIGGRLLALPWPGRGNRTRSRHFSRLRWIVHRAREVWVPSQSTADVVESRFGAGSVIVPYGIDTGFFSADPVVIRDPFTLVCVAPLLPHGNHAALVRAAARAEAKFRLRFLGQGPERPGLEALAADLGIVCSFEPDASPAARRAAFRAAGAVICPSRYEGFGAAALEAMACGAPIVASDIPAHREILGSWAHYFGLDDDIALAGAIRAAGAQPGRGSGWLERYTLASAAERFAAELSRVTAAAASAARPGGH